MTKSNTYLFATVLCLIPENVYGRPLKNGKSTGSWLPVILPKIFSVVIKLTMLKTIAIIV